MKHLTKWTTISAVAAMAVTPAMTTTVDAAEVSIENLSFSYNDDSIYTTYDEFSRALLLGSGDFYEFVMKKGPALQAVGLADGTYVDYDTYAKKVLMSSEDAMVILEELSNDSSSTIPESDVSEYQEIKGFDEKLEPILGDVVIPEVISIT